MATSDASKLVVKKWVSVRRTTRAAASERLIDYKVDARKDFEGVGKDSKDACLPIRQENASQRLQVYEYWRDASTELNASCGTSVAVGCRKHKREHKKTFKPMDWGVLGLQVPLLPRREFESSAG